MMVPESVSLFVIERVSLPLSCKFPLFASVPAVKFLPLMSSFASDSIVSVPVAVVAFRRETSDFLSI